MKRLVFAVVGVLILAPLIIAGCVEKGPVGLTAEEECAVTSSCITCHTDKDLLKEVAVADPAEAKSEATSGEG